MSPAERSVVVEEATEADLREAIQNALVAARVTLDELREQARTSRFSSEEARYAWFVVSSVADLAVPA
jgi:hypothetical protein